MKGGDFINDIKKNTLKNYCIVEILFFKILYGEIERGRVVKICICALTLIFFESEVCIGNKSKLMKSGGYSFKLYMNG